METPPTPLSSVAPSGSFLAARALTGLRLILGGWVALTVIALANRLVSTYSATEIAAADVENALTVSRIAGTLFLVDQYLAWLAGICVGLGLWLYARSGGASARARGVIWAAITGWLVSILSETTALILSMVQEAGVHLSSESWQAFWNWFWLPGFLADVACPLLLLVAIARVEGFAGRQPPNGKLIAAGIGIACNYGFLLLTIRGPGVSLEWFPRLDPWVHFWLATPLSLGMITALVLALLEHIRRLKQSGLQIVGESPLAVKPIDFPAAVRDGLWTYRSALITRLWVMVGGVIMILLAGLGEAVEVVKFLMVAVALVSLIAGIAMVVGLAQYAAVPERTGAKGAALAAVSLMGIGLLLDLVGLVLVIMVVSGDFSTVMHVATVSPFVEGFAQTIGLCSAIALLISFSRLGQALALPGAADRVVTLGFMFGVAIPLVVFTRVALVKQWIVGVRGLVLAGAVLALAVTALILFLGLLKSLLNRLTGSRAEAAAE